MTLNWGRVRGRDCDDDSNGRSELADAALHTILLPERGREQAPEEITIRLADCDGNRNRANMLLKRMYSWRGYGANHQLPSTPNCVSFAASSQADVIGTLTLTVDSSAGLAADRTFKDEVDKFRKAPGAKLCELTKFAFDTASPARPRLAALFHIIFIYGSLHFDCTDLFIEVNPRHQRFYEVMLGFKSVGMPQLNETVGAPSQLMWLNVADIRRHIDMHARNDCEAGRSLYPYFFSAKEEQGIYGRLAGMNEKSFLAEPEADRRLIARARWFPTARTGSLAD